jgi:hypothetical protein
MNLALSPWLDFCQRCGEEVLGAGRLIVRLQPNPEPLRHAEEPRQTQATIGGDGARTRHDFADASLRHADFFGQPILDDARGLQEFFQQDFAAEQRLDIGAFERPDGHKEIITTRVSIVKGQGPRGLAILRVFSA